MGYTVSPEGLYENIVRGSQLKIPMYVTETGAADRTEKEEARLACIETYFSQVQCLDASTCFATLSFSKLHKLFLGYFDPALSGL